MKNFIKKVRVLRFQEFKKEYKNPLQTFLHLADVTPALLDKQLDDIDVFFLRQRFNEPTQTLIPELKPSCVCREILNPDDDLALCPNESCGQYMHVSCLRHNADRKCYDCKSEFPIRDLVSSLKRHQKEESKNENSHQSDD